MGYRIGQILLCAMHRIQVPATGEHIAESICQLLKIDCNKHLLDLVCNILKAGIHIGGILQSDDGLYSLNLSEKHLSAINNGTLGGTIVHVEDIDDQDVEMDLFDFSVTENQEKLEEEMNIVDTELSKVIETMKTIHIDNDLDHDEDMNDLYKLDACPVCATQIKIRRD